MTIENKMKFKCNDWVRIKAAIRNFIKILQTVIPCFHHVKRICSKQSKQWQLTFLFCFQFVIRIIVRRSTIGNLSRIAIFLGGCIIIIRQWAICNSSVGNRFRRGCHRRSASLFSTAADGAFLMTAISGIELIEIVTLIQITGVTFCSLLHKQKRKINIEMK